MRGGASSVSRDQQTPPLTAITYNPPIYRRNVDDTRRSSSDRCQSQIFVENRDFSPVRGPRRNTVITLGIEKLECCGYGEKNLKICLFVSTEYTNVTDIQMDGQTDTARRHRQRLCIVSRGKKLSY